MVGCPLKNGKEYPLFDYEHIIFNKLFTKEPREEYSFKNKHLWCLKSTGLGISEVILRIMGWLCTSTELYKNQDTQMVIVTGPNQDLAIKLIKRLKSIFERKLGLTFQNKETVLELNGCQIEAYPSNHIDSFRSLTNPKFIFCDESDFWRQGEVEEVRHVAERYVAKSDPYIVLVSTPNAPNGLMDKIEREPEDTCLYKRIKLDYTYGLHKIYTEAEIEKAKHSPSFKREYQLFYLGLEGNIFSVSQIERAVELGELYSLDKMPVNPYCIHSIGIDPGFGSSNTAIVATEFLHEESKIRITYAQEFEHGDPQMIVNLIFQLYQNYGYNNTFLYVDGSNRAFVNLLKVAFNESLNWEKSRISPESMKVCPVNFSTEHKQMLSHLAMLVSKEYLCIPKQFDKLEIALRTAYANEYSLDKERSSYNDLTDALRLSCKMFKIN